MKKIIIIGGGFTGLAAAYDLSRNGYDVTLIEKDKEVGGLAGSFEVNGVQLEKFYHHWFTNDKYIMDIVHELGKDDEIILRTSKTGLYYAKHFYNLSTPLDLLRFNALSFVNRIRLGVLVLSVRYINNWMKLESLTAYEWIKKIGGKQVFEVLWKPLLEGKFGDAAPSVSAVWFWNKLKLRGGSRGEKGAETLAYYKGGFAKLASHITKEIEKNGGKIMLNCSVEKLIADGKKITGVKTDIGIYDADTVLVTAPLPDYRRLINDIGTKEYLQSLEKIPFLANVCMVLELNRSLSDTYWLNVSDPGFPYVGIIEHTNFEPAESYKGVHIIYLSKYLPEDSDMFRMNDEELLSFSIPHIKKMLPEFDKSWIVNHHVWRARYSQPVVVKNYSKLIPSSETPFENLYLSTMAQIYPEDRGTNYAIREGRKIAQKIISKGRNDA